MMMCDVLTGCRESQRGRCKLESALWHVLPTPGATLLSLYALHFSFAIVNHSVLPGFEYQSNNFLCMH